jgi:hypothetical protein
LFALSLAAILLAAQATSPPAFEPAYAAGAAKSSCVEVPFSPEVDWGTPSLTEGLLGWNVNAWRLEIFAGAPTCARSAEPLHSRFVACLIRAPARLIYGSREQSRTRAFRIEAFGAHRIGADASGLSCRHLSIEEEQ